MCMQCQGLMSCRPHLCNKQHRGRRSVAEIMAKPPSELPSSTLAAKPDSASAELPEVRRHTRRMAVTTAA